MAKARNKNKGNVAWHLTQKQREFKRKIKRTDQLQVCWFHMVFSFWR